MEHVWPIGPGELILRRGDLCLADVEAIVNAANSRLAGGGGVDGAIHRAAGPELLKACQDIVRKQGPLEPGGAVITPGFKLKAAYVVHTVGPIWRGGGQGESETLRTAYESCLKLAAEAGIKTIAFPAVSCGAYGFPVHKAAGIAISALRHGLAQGLVQSAAMYLYSEDGFKVWSEAARAELGPPR